MITYSHFALGKGRATVAIRLDEDKQDLEFGVALCSPKDQFCKEKGRYIASRRLDAKRNFYMKLSRNPQEKVKDQVRRVIRTAVRGARGNGVPKWATVKVVYPAAPVKNALIVVGVG